VAWRFQLLFISSFLLVNFIILQIMAIKGLIMKEAFKINNLKIHYL